MKNYWTNPKGTQKKKKNTPKVIINSKENSIIRIENFTIEIYPYF